MEGFNEEGGRMKMKKKKKGKNIANERKSDSCGFGAFY